ncbi:MAG: hypothetical protein AAGA48_18420 [Myxococcota bacterium]
MPFHTLHPFFAMFAVASLVAIGCSQPDEEGMPDDRRYVISQITFGPDGSFQSAAAFSNSLEADGEVDPADTVPLPTSSVVSKGPIPGSFLVSSGETPEVFRYEVTEAGVNEFGPVSFAGRGVSVAAGPPTVLLASERKAYYLDLNSLRAFTFDPIELVILDEWTLEGFASPSEMHPEVVLSTQVLRRNSDLLIPVLYRDIANATAASLARILAIDTETDEVQVIEDQRCGMLTFGVELVNGDIYYASDAQNGAFMLARPDANTPGCLLRLKDGERSFDRDFFVSLADVTGTEGSGSLLAGPDGTAYLVAYDDSVLPVPDAFSEIYGASAWRTVRTTLGDTVESATPSNDFPLRSGAIAPISVDGVTYDAQISVYFDSTTLFITSEGPVPQAGLTFSGFPAAIVSLQ